MDSVNKNFSWMAGANVASNLLSITLFIYLARTLGPESFGLLSYIFTLVFFLANFVDLGLSTYGTREVAKDRSRVSEYVSGIVSFRIVIAAIMFGFFFLSGLLSHDIHHLKYLMLGSSIVFFMWALGSEWAFQGVERMHMVFLSMTATGALQLALALVYIKSPADIAKVPVLYMAASIPMTVFLLVKMRFRLKIKGDDLRRIATFLSSSFSIWSISIFAQIYNSLDVFILGLSRTPEEVGYYTVARRIVGTLAGLFTFLAAAVFPSLSRSASGKDVPHFKAATRKFLILGIFLAASVLLPLAIFGTGIITLVVGGEYSPAGLPLKLMTVALVLILFNLPFSTGLIASGYEKDVLKQAFASAVVSIGSNFILMPKYGMIGGSISFLLAESLALIWILCLYRKRILTKGE
ncbi:MAG: flippase [Candidatus Omnitrophica bacterium]|nr:flippase [Candidatus Omnitrophota bacterium]